jgi:CRP/FNR family cyclic AMP-dependent transcriptional regulator
MNGLHVKKRVRTNVVADRVFPVEIPRHSMSHGIDLTESIQTHQHNFQTSITYRGGTMTVKTIERLRENSVFESLDPETLEHLSDLVDVVRLSPSEILFEKGDPGRHLYTVQEGLLKISVTDEASDREKTLALIGENEVVGEMAVFGDQVRSGKAIALRETELLRIPDENFMEIFSSFPEVGRNLISILCERLLMSDEEIQNVTFQTIPGRLAAQLLRLSEKFGESTENGRVISVRLTHDQLADLVGTNRETITRYLNEFEDEGSIRTEDQKIIILDRESLEEWM